MFNLYSDFWLYYNLGINIQHSDFIKFVGLDILLGVDAWSGTDARSDMDAQSLSLGHVHSIFHDISNNEELMSISVELIIPYSKLPPSL